jgi:hypothetical protein
MLKYEDFHDEIFASNPATDEKSVRRLFALVSKHAQSMGLNFENPTKQIKKLKVFNEYSLFFNLPFCQAVSKVQKYNVSTNTYTDITKYTLANHHYFEDYICLLKLEEPLYFYEELHVEAVFGLGEKAPVEIESIIINYLLSKTSATKRDYGNLNIKTASEGDSKFEFFESKMANNLDINQDLYFQNLFIDYI